MLNEIQTFGRRKGRALTAKEKELLEIVLPGLIIDFEKLSKAKEYFLEIGFGNGYHLANLAKNSTNHCYIGCEPYIKGVANLLKIIENDDISNIKIYQDDARNLLCNLEDRFLSAIYLLFPDPWPKTKHHKRRLVNHKTLSLFAKKLKTNGNLIIATDHLSYAKWIYQFLTLNEFFEFNRTFNECQLEPINWIKTKYQKKAESLGIKPYFFEARAKY